MVELKTVGGVKLHKLKRGFGRLVLYSGVAGSMVAALLPASATSIFAQGNGASRTINGHVVSGRFLEEWNKQGSEQANVYVNGLPITDRRPEISLTGRQDL